MKHKVAELTGPLLDAAVALALGYEVAQTTYRGGHPYWVWRSPGTIESGIGRDGWICIPDFHKDWHDSGPIIERERIALVGWHGQWDAAVNGFVDAEGGITSDPRRGQRSGEAEDAPTALIAAMRAFVASKLGDEVELPTPTA